uniref:heme oxygenase (biliverdin-producing) n=1 Tax=Callorhinchus milii TaxID=7868 RepID=A0A4W3HQI1_CALMI
MLVTEGKALSEVEDIGMDVDFTSPTDLSEILKEGTKEAHDRAENTQFVKDFLKGKIHLELFKLGTAALYFTYSLHRREPLERDLEYFFGPDWKNEIQSSDATTAYVERIHYVGEFEPELLVAHAYTRYMGDLSGGQVLKKVAQRALHFPSTGEGVQFYIFDNISNPTQFKQLYRARLNSLELDRRNKERVVEEANRAFEFNMQVFEELDQIGKLLPKAPEGGHLMHDGKGNPRMCPFYTAKGNVESSECPYRTVVSLLKSSSFQLVLAIVVALIAATYLML